MGTVRILLKILRPPLPTCLIQSRNIHTSSKCSQCGQKKVITEDKDIRDLQWTKWWDGEFGKHPGKCNIPPVSLPNNMQESITEYLTDYYEMEDKTKIITVCEKLCKVLHSRPLQINSEQVDRTEPAKKGINKEDLKKFYSEEPRSKKREENRQKSLQGAWKQIVYDRLMCAAYLIGRTPAAYAASLRVLTEIKKRRPDFQPQTMLDYGSGTGTAVWAANSLWGSTLTEFLCIDWSNIMNELARFIFTAGNTESELMGINLRPILPVSFKNKFDIVTAAYTLSELPSEKLRLTTLKILWEKTNDYLILIEQGNFSGYNIMMEARNLLTAGIEGADMTKSTRHNRAIKTGFVFAPCPHAMLCPKWKKDSVCAFQQKYVTPTYSRKYNKIHTVRTESFTYMIFAKKEPEDYWPRAIKNPCKINNCTQCHYCMPSGNIQHYAMTKVKCSRDLLYTARKTSLGDLLPYNSSRKR